MKNSGSLSIKGIRIDPRVLRKESVRRCGDIKCAAACCSDGVWLREDEPPRILKWASEIKDCLPPARHDESKWFEQGKDELGTISVEDPLRPKDCSACSSNSTASVPCRSYPRRTSLAGPA